MEKFTAFHGTSYPIEYFNLEHLGEHQGQTIFSGIYFTTSLTEAKEYATLSSEKTKLPPKLYVAELELEHPLYANKGNRFFSTKADFMKFVREFFPDFFDEKGELLYYKRGYLEEKYSTYFGQYNFIKYAAKENQMSVAEMQDWLGFDSCIDGTTIVVSNLNCIQSFEEVPFSSTQSSVEELSATEKIADRYLINSRHGADYKTMPGNRYKRRMRIRDKGAARVWYDIDVNKFFNKDEFLCHIPVIGETNEYIEEVEIKNWLPVLRQDIKVDGFSVIAFRKSLTKAMRNLNIKINCNCPDFLYSGFAYYRTQDNENSGRPENRPPVVRNPDNNKGDGCKHILHILSNRTWISRVARILFNYCLNLYKQNKPLFERTIGKKLEITDEMVEGRPIEKKKKPTPPPQTIEKEPEQIEETQDVEIEEEPKEEGSTETFAGEAYYGNYYKNNKSFDEDQQFMIDTATSLGISILDYASPKNSPEQIGELTSDIQSNLPSNVIEILSDPDLSVREHQVLREAYLKGIDLIPYIGEDPEVLRQLMLGVKQGIPIKELLAPGRNHRQIEQLRTAYKLDKNLFRELSNQNLNYEQLKAEIKRWKDANIGS